MFKATASLLAICGAAALASADEVVINFDFWPGPDGKLGTGDDVPIVAPTLFSNQFEQLTDQFAAVGVLFEPGPPINDKNEILDAATFTTPPPHTPPNLLASFGTLTIEARFIVPVTKVSALIGISAGADRMDAYDAGGALLGSVVGDDVVVTIDPGVEIARIVVTPVISTTPAIDNLTITTDAGCYPDCDGSGNLDLFDFLCFVNEFNNGDPYADCDGSGTLDLFDFLCFVNAFNAGCP